MESGYDGWQLTCHCIVHHMYHADVSKGSSEALPFANELNNFFSFSPHLSDEFVFHCRGV